jgi:hypothetical protein
MRVVPCCALTFHCCSMWNIRVTGVYCTKFPHRLSVADANIMITVEPGYNDIGLYDTSLIESDILWYQLIRHC